MKVTQNPASSAQAQSLEQTKSTEKAEKAKAARGQEIATTGTKGARAPRESVEISDDARLLQRAKEAAQNAPTGGVDRAAHIAALKQSILDGTYRPDSAKIADKLVDEHLLNNFGKNDL